MEVGPHVSQMLSTIDLGEVVSKSRQKTMPPWDDGSLILQVAHCSGHESMSQSLESQQGRECHEDILRVPLP